MSGLDAQITCCITAPGIGCRLRLQCVSARVFARGEVEMRGEKESRGRERFDKRDLARRSRTRNLRGNQSIFHCPDDVTLR